jgi:hypothetical protein
MNQTKPVSCQKEMLPLCPSSADAGYGCGCGSGAVPGRLPGRKQRFVSGDLASPVGPLPRVTSSLTGCDRWGAFKARWGVGRMEYAVDPGLYALGDPGRDSPVLVSANYKMSFDVLRSALPGRDAWLLVLDTMGINVWCAAGKGTFGTEELVRRIEVSRLKEIVAHRSLILPQLGAPGVAAHMVKKRSGFSVHYGPIAACDIPAYLDAGGKATPAMRLKRFPLRERAVLIPVELVEALKPSALIVPLLFLIGGLGGPAGFWATALQEGVFAALAFLSALFAGAVLHPLLLPYLPGRAFSTKGLVLGLLMALAFLSLKAPAVVGWSGGIGVLAWLLIIPAVTAYLAMNFTGCSTYTSPSGVNREMRWALPLEIGLALAGAVLWIASRLNA